MTFRLRRSGFLSCVLAALLGLTSAASTDQRPAVAAASDLQFALTEIAERFEAETGAAVRLSFGSSGNFARQIRQGAPFELYFSADEAFVLDLARDGFARDEGTLYAIGRIALVVAPGAPFEPDATLEDLRSALEEGRLSRFAIANPEHAPYGRAAREALESRGLWEAIEPHLVLGENVSQAAQFAVTGNAQGGLVAYSLVLAEGISSRAAHVLIPDEWHRPLLQRMALIEGAGPVAEQFYDYLQAPAAREILEAYGFALPDEES